MHQPLERVPRIQRGQHRFPLGKASGPVVLEGGITAHVHPAAVALTEDRLRSPATRLTAELVGVAAGGGVRVLERDIDRTPWAVAQRLKPGAAGCLSRR